MRSILLELFIVVGVAIGPIVVAVSVAAFIMRRSKLDNLSELRTGD